MAYLGNVPARSFISFERQVFTIVNSQTAYTLSHSVTNENDIRLVVNNVVQEPGSGKAYTATGTTLTLSAALTNGTDEMYCVFLGRATATNAPGAGSVGTSQLAADAVTNAKIADDAISDEQLDPTVITGQTAETSIATDDLILLSDTSASGALRKMTRANFVSGIGGTMTPAFSVRISGNQSIANNEAATKITFDTEDIDSDNKFASNKFTPGVVGKYFISLGAVIENGTNGEMELAIIQIYKNGSAISGSDARVDFRGNQGRGAGPTANVLIDLDADDYIEGYAFNKSGGGSANIMAYGTRMQGFKIIE